VPVGIALTIVAWTLALALTAGVAYVIFLAVRWPVRIWLSGERKRAMLAGMAVTFGLLVWYAGSRVAP
jgi:hypothetical protein